MLTLAENTTYEYTGLVTGPFKVHKAGVSLTYKGDHFEALLNQEGEELTFTVSIVNNDNDKIMLKSEPFSPPTTSEFTNMILVCTAAMTEGALTGTIEIPAYSVTLSLDFQRA